MLEVFNNIIQGSDEWFALRNGSLGGSTIGKATAKGGGKVRKKLMYELAGEILTGQPAEGYKFQHADRGKEFEAVAKDLYSFTWGIDVEEVALIRDTDKPHCHYSPDGLIELDGLIEIKCRIPSVWIEAKQDGYCPIDTIKQIQWGLYVCQRGYCDYIQYCPEIADAGYNSLVVERIKRDEKIIKELAIEAEQFITETLTLVEKIKS